MWQFLITESHLPKLARMIKPQIDRDGCCTAVLFAIGPSVAVSRPAPEEFRKSLLEIVRQPDLCVAVRGRHHTSRRQIEMLLRLEYRHINKSGLRRSRL